MTFQVPMIRRDLRCFGGGGRGGGKEERERGRETGNQNGDGPLTNARSSRMMPSTLRGKLTSKQRFINRQTTNQYKVSTLREPSESPEILREGCKSLR